jgi:predicted nucleic acid-binding protein
MTRFIDTNVFIYALTAHPRFGKTAKTILERLEQGEQAITSTLVLCEIAWVLEVMGRQGDIKLALDKITSYKALTVVGIDEDDLLMGANYLAIQKIDFNDGVNLAVMSRLGVTEIYSNDQKHLAKAKSIKTLFE